MDGSARLGVAAAIALVAGCGGAPVTPRTVVLARGTLAYAVAGDDHRVVSVELDERFALVVRRTGDPRILHRVDLGPPEHDIVALAMVGDRAWVGGDDGVVRAVDLERGAVVASWPTGAAVTALASRPPCASGATRCGGLADDDLVVVGDATGALCLRRGRDGALLQCVQAASRAVTSLRLAGDEIVAFAGSHTTWQLPSLRRHPSAPLSPLRWQNGDIVVAGRTVELATGPRRRRLVTLGGAVRAVAILPGGALAVAGWIADLSDPSLVLLAPVD